MYYTLFVLVTVCNSHLSVLPLNVSMLMAGKVKYVAPVPMLVIHD